MFVAHLQQKISDWPDPFFSLQFVSSLVSVPQKSDVLLHKRSSWTDWPNSRPGRACCCDKKNEYPSWGIPWLGAVDSVGSSAGGLRRFWQPSSEYWFLNLRAFVEWSHLGQIALENHGKFQTQQTNPKREKFAPFPQFCFGNAAPGLAKNRRNRNSQSLAGE